MDKGIMDEKRRMIKSFSNAVLELRNSADDISSFIENELKKETDPIDKAKLHEDRRKFADIFILVTAVFNITNNNLPFASIMRANGVLSEDASEK